MHRARVNQTPVGSGDQEPVAYQYAESTPAIPPGFAHFVDSFGSSPSPVLPVNSTHSPEDIELDLKRVLKIGEQHQFNGEKAFSDQDESIKLLPPAAFSNTSLQPYPSVETGNSVSYALQSGFVANREQVRRSLIHLIRTDDAFLDIIHQACFNPRSLRS